MKRPVHISEVTSKVWYEGTDREIRGMALCDIGDAAKVRVGYVELPSGSHTKLALGTRRKRSASHWRRRLPPSRRQLRLLFPKRRLR
jgi:hypothetical protein